MASSTDPGVTSTRLRSSLPAAIHRADASHVASRPIRVQFRPSGLRVFERRHDLCMNSESQTSQAISIAPLGRPYNEAMQDRYWTTIRFLESATNLRRVLAETSGHNPSTSQARGIAACLQQGRLFYEAAQQSAMEIRPLVQFYGAVAFGKALALSTTHADLATLPQSHGLTEISEPCKTISDLRVRIELDGTFQRFNDAVAPMIRVPYFGHRQWPSYVNTPASSSLQLRGYTLSIRDVLSRVPTLHSLYEQTFHQGASSAPVTFYNEPTTPTLWELRIEDPIPFRDLDGLRRIVNCWRAKFPFIRRWTLQSAAQQWGNSQITFINVQPSEHEFDETRFVVHDNAFTTPSNHASNDDVTLIGLSEALSPLGGSFGNLSYAIAPLDDGAYLCEYSLHYLALFLLSSLVRYRPNVWVHAISRSHIGETPADDAPLALLEQFLDHDRIVMPELIAKGLNPKAFR